MYLLSKVAAPWTKLEALDLRQESEPNLHMVYTDTYPVDAVGEGVFW